MLSNFIKHSLSMDGKHDIIDIYSEQSIIIPNQLNFLQIVTQLRTDGVKFIDFVSDFDSTLTRKASHLRDGSDSSYAIYSHSPYFSNELKETKNKLYHQYAPIERDSTMPVEKREELMQEWYSKTIELVSSQVLTEKQLEESLLLTNMKLRHGVIELFDIISHYEVPLYIISAGIIDIISKFIKLAVPFEMLKNMQIIANGKIDGHYMKPFVTATNKDKFLTKERYPNLRKNAIVVGDLVDDISMVSKSAYKSMLKIGFFNTIHNDDSSIDPYLKNYDIILKGNGSLYHICYILSKIIDIPMTYQENELSQLLNKI